MHRDDSMWIFLSTTTFFTTRGWHSSVWASTSQMAPFPISPLSIYLWDPFWPDLPPKAPQVSHWMLGFSNLRVFHLCQCLQCGFPSSSAFPDSRQLSSCIFFPYTAQTPTCAQTSLSAQDFALSFPGETEASAYTPELTSPHHVAYA